MDGGFLVPIGFFAMIAAIVLVPRYFKNKESQDVQATVRAAIDKGQELPAELVDAITKERRPANSPVRDIRGGVIWLAVAAGFAGFGYYIGWYADEAQPAFYAMAAFPGFIGLAFLAMGLVGLATKSK
jgi:hypothetical protein